MNVFVTDPVSLLLAGLALVMTVSVSLYSRGYAVSDVIWQRRAFASAPWAFCLFSCLAVFSGDWFLFALFVELASLALVFMIFFGDARAAALYLLTQLAGTALLLVGSAILLHQTGSAAIGPVPPKLLWYFIPALGIKAALPGLHFWLPEVHSKAPAPASALLSGFAVKLGVFGLARLASPETGTLYLALGVFMALFGVLQALLQHDAKRLLAYHTISQLGYVISAVGTGTPLGLAAGMFHAVAHGLFKGLLFLSAGSLEKAFGTRDLRQLGGAAALLPVTFALFTVGALAISGFPGLSGFASKALVKASVKDIHSTAGVWVLQAASVGTVISFCKLGYFAFIRKGTWSLETLPGEGRGSVKNSRRNLGMAIAAAATVLLGLRPDLVPVFLGEGGYPFFALSTVTSALLPILGGLLLFALLKKALEPAEHHVPDVDDLLAATGPFFRKIPDTLGALQSGGLRVYIAYVIIAALALFAYLVR
jgi:multicomponent Na+:H+ antiporter subunit D